MQSKRFQWEVPLMQKWNMQIRSHVVVQGITEPVQFSHWAAPIVPMQKSDGSIRICGESGTINSELCSQAAYVPHSQDWGPYNMLLLVCVCVGGGIDLSDAYL